MAHILRTLASLISIYTMLCFVRIFLTWFPAAAYSQFGRILASICDPYLNAFRRFRFLRFSSFDFTPAIAICVLIGFSTILSNIAVAGTITVGYILAIIVNLIWSVFSSVTGFIIIILIIRLAVLIFSRQYNPIWEQLDRTVSPIVFKLTGIFSRNQKPYKTALIISIITAGIIYLALKMIFRILIAMLISLPF